MKPQNVVNGSRAVVSHGQKHGTSEWKVCASDGAMNTSNPIREIIETMNLAENPNKKVIPLSIGDPTIFGNLKPCKEILDALQRANACGKHYGYQIAAGMESAREAVAEYHFKCTGNRVKVQVSRNFWHFMFIVFSLASMEGRMNVPSNVENIHTNYDAGLSPLGRNLSQRLFACN